ncbi:MAG: hypothetical protein KDJ75_04890 [Alphaproteobacteria bacterium]|nr:hypothetical protein [Alphaproteobacteria bacterium]
MTIFSQELIWWIGMFEFPVMGGLFWLIWRTRTEGENALSHVQSLLEQRSTQLRDALSAFKLEVAKNYASHSDLRELEGRLTSHLLRIEAKLDTTALKAEAASAERVSKK